jgi:hypothetical protein
MADSSTKRSILISAGSEVRVIAFSEPPNKSRLFLQDLRSTTQTGKVLKVSEFSAHYFFLKNLPNLAMIPSAVSSPLFTFSTAALNAKHCLGFESINRLRSASARDCHIALGPPRV